MASCSIHVLSNKNAQIEKVTNITSEKHTLLDLFEAMGFDDRTFFMMELGMGYVPLMFFPGIPVPEHQFPGNSRVPGKYMIYKKKNYNKE